MELFLFQVADIKSSDIVNDQTCSRQPSCPHSVVTLYFKYPTAAFLKLSGAPLEKGDMLRKVAQSVVVFLMDNISVLYCIFIVVINPRLSMNQIKEHYYKCLKN